MLVITYLTLLFLAVGIHAHGRSLTIVPVKGGCSALPRYNNATNIAGPWGLKAHDCKNSTASREHCTIDGFGASSDVKRSTQEKRIDKGSVCATSKPFFYLFFPYISTNGWDRSRFPTALSLAIPSFAATAP